MKELYIGFDDTDSRKGMCTTYVATRVINDFDLDLISKPRLIRLNPNVPWKTRGNGAIGLDIKTINPKELKEKITELITDLREEKSNTGIVFFDRDPKKIDKIKKISKKSIKEIVDLKKAKSLAKKYGETREFNSGRGIVGALTAAGYTFNDYTYELIAYRKKKAWGTLRDINKKDVWEISDKKYPKIWDTVDRENNQTVFDPNSPCPVLYGIRGDFKKEIIDASQKIRSERKTYQTLFKTNQGTDEHIQEIEKIKEIKPFTSVKVKGKVEKPPETKEGGHVFFKIRDKTGKIDCAAFEPTKGFRDIIKKLIKGDVVTAYGGVSEKPLTINLEKIEIQELNENIIYKNPKCPNCGINMESAGKNQGFRCKKCKEKAKKKREIHKERKLNEGIYEVPPVARRHISRPKIRKKIKKLKNNRMFF
ncbi:MAG: tRNA(Ile2) 2-agmatinylcytidine synthetase, containing Zn-ribbon and OB-fold domain TiaS [Candidatus Methanohalarchaeum thermophilum]|uniref:tRNA(Ile2) 2-agmatinylcytidine synthetase TiaS n=1 Tax=Methanohalarchaeum thermophilum TaxID=1903181 RepID=A0A1Q6DUG3_METT1|nr:MAG: tRNA(Ile2) 2-agmatinylcytidine synthetase, containing Zn-ribbon and OB-fold domain TiaS [Candidatus Methanohalarchaeum thermophilum]